MKSRKSSMQHSFSKVPQINIPRSSFDRTHTNKTTFDAGLLIPVYVDEALPGDTFNLKMTAFARLATPIVPIMDNMFMDTHFFAVPYRLVWDNWEKFNGAQDDPGDSTDFTIPVINVGNFGVSTIHDYMGIRPGIPGTVYNSLHLRAYNLIFNTWFKDENLQDNEEVLTTDGPDPIGNYALLRRGKRHDYFTSSLPFPQKGPSVELPLGTVAPITTTSGWSPGDDVRIVDPDTVGDWIDLNSGVPTKLEYGATGTGPSNLLADLSSATAATINQLREAATIQQLYEMDARGGTRYTEIIKVHFGVTSPDARLQRPEYLGGGSSPVNISAVQQTSSTDATTPQGNLAAFGTVSLNNHGFTKSFTEHCLILGLVSVRADLTYQQGMPRMFRRQTRFDYYLPTFANIGEQAVLNGEIYYQGSAAPGVDDLVFGYQERYAEYRYAESKISGLFRSDAAGTLDFWHLSQDFSVLPVLDDTFIQDTPPVDRVIAVPAEPHFIFDSHFSLRCARPMPMYASPGLKRF